MERWGIECWRSIYLWWYSLDLMLDPTSWSHRIDDFSNEWRMCVVEFAPIDGRCSTFQCVQDWHLWIEVQIKVWILYECLREKKRLCLMINLCLFTCLNTNRSNEQMWRSSSRFTLFWLRYFMVRLIIQPFKCHIILQSSSVPNGQTLFVFAIHHSPL